MYAGTPYWSPITTTKNDNLTIKIKSINKLTNKLTKTLIIEPSYNEVISYLYYADEYERVPSFLILPSLLKSLTLC